jgi:hypothetical protein
MTYSILLDVDQHLVPKNKFAVSFSGTLLQCRSQTHHGPQYLSWLRSDFTMTDIEAKSLTNDQGGTDPGRIFKLDDIAAATVVAPAIVVIRKRKRKSRSNAQGPRP